MSTHTAVVLGATGLVGSHLVRVLAGDAAVHQVLAPVRRPVMAWMDQPRIAAPVVDFEELEEHRAHLRCRQLFICLGTTMKKAGGKDAFRRVDFGYVVDAARVARAEGAREVFLVSAAGADPHSWVFYSRVKGQAEEGLRGLGFASTYVLRPSLLTGNRNESRPAERVAMVLGRALAPLMVGPLRRYRPVEALVVARAMARLAADPKPGIHVVESEEIQRLGA